MYNFGTRKLKFTGACYTSSINKADKKLRKSEDHKKGN